MRPSRAFAFVATLALACQSGPQPSPDPSTSTTPSAEVTIDLDRTTYSAGSQVQLRVTNHTSGALGYNPCTRSIERRQDSGWTLIVESDRVCTMQLYLLNPHASRTDATDLPRSLEPGTYRIALGFTREGPGVTPPTPAATLRAVSASFQVQ